MISRNISILLFVFLSTHGISAQTYRAKILDTLRIPVHYQNVFGQRLAYYEAGSPQAPVVILLPNLGWDSNQWAQNVGDLSKSYHLYLIDPLGTGKSDKPLIDYKMDTWTDGFAEFMRVQGIHSATFVGSVMGGALSVQMALDHPELVNAIVVAASNSGPGAHEGGSKSTLSGPSIKGTRAGLLEAFYDSSLVTDSVVRIRVARKLAAGDGYTIQRHLSDHRAPYSTDELARIVVPALFVWCKQDVTTPLSWGIDYAKALQKGKLEVIDRCGHLPNLEQPLEFNRVVLKFLGDIQFIR